MIKTFPLSAIIAIALLVCACSSPASAKRLHKERWYQEQGCTGVTEYRLPDRTRVDCLLEDYAVEYDFGRKWAEAIGQSLHYGRMSATRGRTNDCWASNFALTQPIVLSVVSYLDMRPW